MGALEGGADVSRAGWRYKLAPMSRGNPPKRSRTRARDRPERVAELAESGEAELIDVRRDYEHEAGHIAGARHVELNDLTAQADSIPKDRPVVFYCRGGSRSAMAAEAFSPGGIRRPQHGRRHHRLGRARDCRSSPRTARSRGRGRSDGSRTPPPAARAAGEDAAGSRGLRRSRTRSSRASAPGSPSSTASSDPLLRARRRRRAGARRRHRRHRPGPRRPGRLRDEGRPRRAPRRGGRRRASASEAAAGRRRRARRPRDASSSPRSQSLRSDQSATDQEISVLQDDIADLRERLSALESARHRRLRRPRGGDDA